MRHTYTSLKILLRSQISYFAPCLHPVLHLGVDSFVIKSLHVNTHKLRHMTMSPVSPQGSRHKLSSFIRLESGADFKPMRVCVCSAYLRALLWTMIGNVELLSSPAPDNTELQRSPRPAPGTRGQQPIRGQYPGT